MEIDIFQIIGNFRVQPYRVMVKFKTIHSFNSLQWRCLSAKKKRYGQRIILNYRPLSFSFKSIRPGSTRREHLIGSINQLERGEVGGGGVRSPVRYRGNCA